MSVDPDRVAAARLLLARLGVTVDDLQRADRPRVPTMAEYLPQVRAAAGPGARRTYGFGRPCVAMPEWYVGWQPPRRGQRDRTPDRESYTVDVHEPHT